MPSHRAYSDELTQLASRAADANTVKITPKPQLVVADDLPAAVAACVSAAASKAIAARGAFSIAIAGGSLVKMLGAMAELPGIDWSKWHVGWVDERCVPHSDPESNYGGALAAWLSKVGIPKEQVYAIDDKEGGGGLTAATARADAYEEKLKAVTALPRDAAGLPIFDLLLLGFGPDGHICSLFPGHPLLDDASGRWILPIGDSPKPPPERITLSLAAVNSARAVALVGSGSSKAEPVAHAFASHVKMHVRPALPCARASGAGPTPPLWLLDQPAAALLEAATRAAYGDPDGKPFEFGAHFV